MDGMNLLNQPTYYALDTSGDRVSISLEIATLLTNSL